MASVLAWRPGGGARPCPGVARGAASGSPCGSAGSTSTAKMGAARPEAEQPRRREGGERLSRASRLHCSPEIRGLFERGKRKRTVHLDVLLRSFPRIASPPRGAGPEAPAHRGRAQSSEEAASRARPDPDPARAAERGSECGCDGTSPPRGVRSFVCTAQGRDRHRGRPAVFRTVLLAVIRFYRSGISPWLPPACRYTPSCSNYALEAVGRHGPARGGWLTARRLLRCHPWGGSGFDPVPDVHEADKE